MKIEKIIFVRAKQSTLESVKNIVRFFSKSNSHLLFITTDPDRALSLINPTKNYIFVSGNHFKDTRRHSLSKLALIVRSLSPNSIIIGYSSTFNEQSDNNLDYFIDLNDQSYLKSIKPSDIMDYNMKGLSVQNYRLGTFLSLPFDLLDKERILEILEAPIDWERDLIDIKNKIYDAP